MERGTSGAFWRPLQPIVGHNSMLACVHDSKYSTSLKIRLFWGRRLDAISFQPAPWLCHQIFCGGRFNSISLQPAPLFTPKSLSFPCRHVQTTSALTTKPHPALSLAKRDDLSTGTDPINHLSSMMPNSLGSRPLRLYPFKLNSLLPCTAYSMVMAWLPNVQNQPISEVARILRKQKPWRFAGSAGFCLLAAFYYNNWISFIQWSQ